MNQGVIQTTSQPARCHSEPKTSPNKSGDKIPAAISGPMPALNKVLKTSTVKSPRRPSRCSAGARDRYTWLIDVPISDIGACITNMAIIK